MDFRFLINDFFFSFSPIYFSFLNILSCFNDFYYHKKIIVILSW
jgi:hypothetical protein